MSERREVPTNVLLAALREVANRHGCGRINELSAHLADDIEAALKAAWAEYTRRDEQMAGAASTDSQAVKGDQRVSGMIAVLDEMLKAAIDGAGQTAEGSPWQEIATKAVLAAFRWLSENPIVPTVEQMDSLFEAHAWLDKDSVRFGAREWQRWMFGSYCGVPAEIQDLVGGYEGSKYQTLMKTLAVEAYRRGREAAK